MSFGFSISDLITVGELAFKLYHGCYKVARGAPHEVQLLADEMKTLSSSLSILQAEAKDPDSILVKAGEDRVRLVNDMVHGIGETLKKLEKAAEKYGMLVSSSKRKQVWTKFKWSMELSSIDALRNKLIYHNTCMNLLLTSVGNSSLQRLELSNRALEKSITEVKSLMLPNSAQQRGVAPTISAMDDEADGASLGAAFMRNAEASQPWRTINLDLWIEAGRWWLIRSQMELYSVLEPGRSFPLAAYTNLMKASWILVDIIASHPQIPFAAATTVADVHSLSVHIKRVLSDLVGLDGKVPQLSELLGQDPRIWESSSSARGLLLRPQRKARGSKDWVVEGGEHVLYQEFAICASEQSAELQPCIVLLLVQQDVKAARIVAQNQNGSTVFEIHSPNVAAKTQMNEDKALHFCDIGTITFTTNRDKQRLRCVIEGVQFYLYCLDPKMAKLDDLKAFILLTALKNNCEDVITTIVQEPQSQADILSTTTESSPLDVACALAFRQMKGLLEPRELQHRGTTLFWWASQAGDPLLVEILLGHNDWYNNNFDDFWSSSEGRAMLPTASYYGHLSIVKSFLAKGADIEAIDLRYTMQTALQNASQGGHEHVVTYLLESRAVLESKHMSNGQALHLAAEGGHARIIQVLIDGGANIEAKDQQSATALIRAARSGNADIVQLLLDQGADIEAKEPGGTTALYYAALANHIEFVKLLLHRGASLNTIDMTGRTALFAAIRPSSRETLWILLQAGADPLATDRCGMDSTHCAATCREKFPKYSESYLDTRQACSTSEAIVSMVLSKACSLRRASLSPCLPLSRPRRARIKLELLSRTRATLWLNSHHAYIELSATCPPRVEVRHGKCLHIDDRWEKQRAPSFEFIVVHQEEDLDFSFQLGDHGEVQLQVVNGGFRRFDYRYGHNLFHWKHVELDPNAEVITDLPHSDASHYAVCGDPSVCPS